jgi:hypothetical protein
MRCSTRSAASTAPPWTDTCAGSGWNAPTRS